jgi:hypothetical protein
MKPFVTFEPQEHVYTLHGATNAEGEKALPSVTQIIQDNNLGFDFSQLPKLDLAWYGDRGTKVHLACEYLDAGILDWATVDPRILGFVKSYQLGKHEYKFEVCESEKLVFDPLFRFAGTLDRIVRFKPETKLANITAQIDLKAGVPHISHGYQTAAYNICLDGGEYSRHIPRFGLYLREDGSLPGLKAYPDLDDFTIFESAINLYYARRRG